MIKQWHILKPDPQQVQAIQKALGCHPMVATVLVNRGIRSPEEAAALQTVSLNRLRAPFELKGIDGAVARIADALSTGEKILVFGDYDVDGVTATAVLIEFLRAAGARVSHYLPDRRREGYGLKPEHIRQQAADAGIDLIITADCGSNDHEALAAAKACGIDVIITDHHLVTEPFPEAVEIVNPQRGDCKAGFEHLSGAGVAFYVVVALRKYLRDRGYWQERPEPNLKQFCDLVALGTVADIVPLIGENRILTSAGLQLINTNRRMGLQFLREVAGVHDKPVDAEDIAFRLAPRINAAGRIGHAETALTLLLADNRRAARDCAQQLDELNATRQRLEKDVTGDILTRLKADPGLLKHRVLVMADADWDEGVLGIAASKLVNQFYRPVVLLNLENGIGKGSARSIPGIDLFERLSACKRWLDRFGGHAQAAGLSLPEENIAPFRDQLDRVIRETAEPNTFIPRLTLDGELNFSEISAHLVDELDRLKPFGASHHEPLFMAGNVRVASSRVVGGHHRRMTLSQPDHSGRHRIAAIHFNPDERARETDTFDRIAFRVRRNTWNGRTTLQLVVEEAQVTDELSGSNFSCNPSG
jgi:single-stranded-DNA-specific exonuclease